MNYVTMGYVTNTTRLEAKCDEVRLVCHFDVSRLDNLRRSIIARRALAALATEEARIVNLTDEQANKELDSLMTPAEVTRG